MNIKNCFLLCWSLLIVTSAFSQTSDDYQPATFTDPDRLKKIEKAFPVLDRLFTDHAVKNHLPGMAYGIVVDGKLVHTGVYGYTDVDAKIPVTASSLFRIASMSKSFTAMAILKLRDEGKLNLDEPASTYIPELKNFKYPTADAPPITIRHLLTHGAGFPEDNPWGDRQLADTDKELVDFLKKQPSFSNPPGIAFEYSNLGFALLGKIITNVSGQSYQDYIREHIWQALGMTTAEWEYSNVEKNKLAHGYRWLNNEWKEEELLHDTPDGSWGAMGSMICSIDEFAKYMAMHLAAWPPNNSLDNGPVKRSTVREMHHPWRFNGLNVNYKYPDGRICPIASAYNYGLGWLMDCVGKVYIGHSGGLPGFGTQWRIMPDYGIGVVSFANRTYAPMGTINLMALDTIVKLAQLKPRELPASAILIQRSNELMKIFPDWKDTGENGLFAENFFEDNPVDTLRKQFRTLYTKAGAIKGIKSIHAENQLRGTFIIEGTKTNIEVYFTLSPENPPLIQELHVRESVKK
jgi:CubicO group peptidase (beta-lactamase class C family)